MTFSMSDVERLAAIEEIRRLKARRDHALDRKDWVTYAAVHAPDHVSHNDGHEVQNSPQHVIEGLKAALDGVTTCHQSHTPEITFEGPGKVSVVWSMEDNLWWKQDDGDHWLHGFGFYHEKCEKRDGEWLFTYRRLERIRVMTSPGARLNK